MLMMLSPGFCFQSDINFSTNGENNFLSLGCLKYNVITCLWVLQRLWVVLFRTYHVAHWARRLISWPKICNFFPGIVRRMQFFAFLSKKIEQFNELKVKFIGIFCGIDNPNQNRKILNTFRFFIFKKIIRRRTQSIFIHD